MAHNLLNILLVFVFAFLTGCTQTQYGIINNDEKVVYVEVPVYIESEVPTEPGVIWVDSFTQPQSVDGVDILWIIDTSGSMSQYDDSLMAGIEAMLSALPESGWRLAMLSNDPTKALIESQFPLVPGDDIDDALDMYSIMGRGGLEEGFDAAYEYIMNNPYALTWMRHDAALLIVFVSDEEEQSNDHFQDIEDFKNWYSRQRGGSAFLASIVNVDLADTVCDPNPMTINIGYRYIDATDHFNGSIVDICSDDWSAGVVEASNQIEPHESWTLTHQPIVDSIRVFINGQLSERSTWNYDFYNNEIDFVDIPGGNDLVEIGYRYYEIQDTGDTGP